jgi:hypothetical protein
VISENEKRPTKKEQLLLAERDAQSFERDMRLINSKSELMHSATTDANEISAKLSALELPTNQMQLLNGILNSVKALDARCWLAEKQNENMKGCLTGLNEIIDRLTKENHKLKIMGAKMDYDDIPWVHAEKWQPMFWYPLPVGSMWLDYVTVVEGYDIFYQDPEEPSDIIPVGLDTFTFQAAVMMCEGHNGKTFDELGYTLRGQKQKK